MRLAILSTAASFSAPASADILLDDFSAGPFSMSAVLIPNPQWDSQSIMIEGQPVTRLAQLPGTGSIAVDANGLAVSTGGSIGYYQSLGPGIPPSGSGMTLTTDDVEPLSPLLDFSSVNKIEVDYEPVVSGTALLTLSVNVHDATLSSSDSLTSTFINVDQPGTYTFVLADLFDEVDPASVGGIRFGFGVTSGVRITRIEALGGAATGQPGAFCEDAGSITGPGLFPFDTSFAGTSGVNAQECGAVDDIFNDQWYEWTADATGRAILSLCTTSGDSIMAVWKAGEGCPPQRQIACDNDGCSVFGPATQSIGVTAGESYLIQIGSAGAPASIDGDLFIDIIANEPGDFCDFAVPFAGEGTLNFDNTGYVPNNIYPTCTNPSNNLWGDYWVRWTANATGLATVSNCGTFPSINTVLSAWDASADCPPTTSLGCSDNGCGLRSSVSFAVVSGTDYLIQVGHVFPSDLGVEALEFDIAAPPDNDNCENASPISGTGTFVFDSSRATLDSSGSSCGSPTRNVWFDWTAPSDGSFTIDTCGSSIDTQLAVWAGNSCPPAIELGCDDNTCGTASRVTVDATSGASYLIEILGDAGSGTLHISRVDPACNQRDSSIGCMPQIDFVGSPTTTGSDNLTLQASQINGATTGFLLWGLTQVSSGPAPGGGLSLPMTTTVRGARRCIFMPRTTATQPTNGTPGACDGTLSALFSQSQMTAAGLLSGNTLLVQWVIIDAGLPGGLATTEALQFTVQ